MKEIGEYYELSGLKIITENLYKVSRVTQSDINGNSWIVSHMCIDPGLTRRTILVPGNTCNLRLIPVSCITLNIGVPIRN